ncbi:MAG: T9SS type A sorting domain-containing protein [Bacteroidetes bacterium]|nr:MAG: T9SS type A sorting domain-containing protein [Bacteroidota bacterium]
MKNLILLITKATFLIYFFLGLSTQILANLPPNIYISSCYQQVTNSGNRITPFKFLNGSAIKITTIPANATTYFFAYEIVNGQAVSNPFIIPYGVDYLLQYDKTFSIVVPPEYVNPGGPGGEIDPMIISTVSFTPTFSPADGTGCFTFNTSRLYNFNPNLDGLCINPAVSIRNPSSNTVSQVQYTGNNQLQFFIPDDGFCDIPLGQGIVGIRCRTMDFEIEIQPCDLNNPNCPTLFYTFPTTVCCECEPWQPSQRTELETNELNEGKMSETYNNIVNDVLIYPNPFVDEIIVITEQSVKQLCIKDLTGKELITAIGNKIETNNLNKGIYLLEIRTPDDTLVQKRIIK